MFTGIVTSVGTVVAVADAPAGKRISVRSTWDSPDLVLGESIAVDGACMTVVAADGPTFGFDASPESLARTTLGDLRSGAAVNLERALRLGDRLGGHHVTGHVDARGELAAIAPHGDCLSVTFAVGAEWLRYLVPKGSVAVDGISLTVNRVDDASRTFEVMIIPHTQEETSLAGKGPGSAVNLELDLLGKYVERLLAGRGA